MFCISDFIRFDGIGKKTCGENENLSNKYAQDEKFNYFWYSKSETAKEKKERYDFSLV